MRAKKTTPGVTIEGTQTKKEAITAIVQHWQTVWAEERDPSSEGNFEKLATNMARHIGKVGSTLQVERPSHSQCCKAAQKAQGKAGGADGWTGSEVASIPDEAWNDFVRMRKIWEQCDDGC